MLSESQEKKLTERYLVSRDALMIEIDKAWAREGLPPLDWTDLAFLQGKRAVVLSGYSGLYIEIEHEQGGNTGWRRSLTGNAQALIQYYVSTGARKNIRYRLSKTGTWNTKQLVTKCQECMQTERRRIQLEKEATAAREVALQKRREDIGEIADCMYLTTLDGKTYTLKIDTASGLSVDDARAINDILKKYYTTREAKARAEALRHGRNILANGLLAEGYIHDNGRTPTWADSAYSWHEASVEIDEYPLIGILDPGRPGLLHCAIEYPTYDYVSFDDSRFAYTADSVEHLMYN